MLQRIAEALDGCRLVGTRVLVAPPHYTGLTVVADVHARERYDADVVHDDVLRALYGLLDPLTGGPGRHRLAVRPVGAVPRGARRAGPDPRRRHGPGGLRDAVPGRRRQRAGARARSSGSTCRRPGWSSPTSTRCGCADARGRSPALPSPHPLGPDAAGALPGRARSSRRFCDALDEVLAPVVSTLDNLPAYLDVATAPDDLLALARGLDRHVARPRPVARSAARCSSGRPCRSRASRARRAASRSRSRRSSGSAPRSRRPGPSAGRWTPTPPSPASRSRRSWCRCSPTEGQPVDEQRLDLVVSVAQARARGAPGRGGAELTSQACRRGGRGRCSAVETPRIRKLEGTRRSDSWKLSAARAVNRTRRRRSSAGPVAPTSGGRTTRRRVVRRR